MLADYEKEFNELEEKTPVLHEQTKAEAGEEDNVTFENDEQVIGHWALIDCLAIYT